MCTIAAALAALTPMITPIMDILYPLNETRIKEQLFMMERFVDEQEHFYKICFHSVMCLVVDIIIVLALACFFANIAEQFVGLINILR